jgi:hypothetical protein
MLTVDSDSLNSTNCEHDYSCLTEKKCGNRDMCNVQYANGEYVLFLHDKEHSKCKFRSNITCEQVCTCPIRYEIYKKYKK